MSELKAYIGPAPDEKGLADYYLKSEADKVIADLIEKNKRLANKDLIMASETIKDLFKEINRYKYKRCEAMAEWCNSEMGRETFACFRPRHTKEVWREEHKYWAKWRKIWFELYKKLKHNNSTVELRSCTE